MSRIRSFSNHQKGENYEFEKKFVSYLRREILQTFRAVGFFINRTRSLSVNAQITLSQSSSNTITDANTVECNQLCCPE